MKPSFGANNSPFDVRTKRHNTMGGSPLVKGGYVYGVSDIMHQHNIGKCTNISVVQNAQKVYGRKFSEDFGYLLQKKLYDLDWNEGSSIFSAMRVSHKIGFLPAEHWTYTTEADSSLPYSTWIAKLKAIPDSEIERLKNLCINRLAGYAMLPTDSQSMARGILDSKAGLICRYDVGEEWYTAKDGRLSWAKADIDPLRPPKTAISGHAVNNVYFDFTTVQEFTLPNTWGKTWNDEGKGHVNHGVYKCTEAWIPYYDVVPAPAPAPFIFTQNMWYMQTSEDIRQLQKRLGVKETAYYGDLTRAAVYKYQKSKGITSYLFGITVGPSTRAELNKV